MQNQKENKWTNKLRNDDLICDTITQKKKYKEKKRKKTHYTENKRLSNTTDVLTIIE
jgi:hypothetical protein